VGGGQAAMTVDDQSSWIPAFAGMTIAVTFDFRANKSESGNR